jgi:hypothetical protein
MPGEQLKTKAQRYKEFIKIYDKYPVATVMRKLNMTQQSQFDELVSKAYEDGLIIPDKIISYTESSRPFSLEEEDYGSIKKPSRITKKGYLTYKNEELKEAKPTKISRAVALYKQMLKDENLWTIHLNHLAIGLS